MNKKIKYIKIFLLCTIVCLSTNKISAIFPINYLRPYDELFYNTTQSDKAQLYTVVEHGFKSQGRSCDGNKVLPFQMWQCSQSTLAMLKGFDQNSEIGQLAQTLHEASDDGIRGHLIPEANVEYTGAVISGRYYLPYNLSLSLHVPIYSLQVQNVCWKDQTIDITKEDALVKNQLTQLLEKRTRELGDLDIGQWKETGIGDIVIGTIWQNSYPQIKQLLRSVSVSLKTGLSLPTAKREEINRALSIGFGNDESFGIYAGGGIDVSWDFHIRAGIDAQFLHLFGSTKERRIKTDPTQGDLLLLATSDSWRDFGITQRYNLFFEFSNIFNGLSLRTTYQFWQHTSDSLSLLTNDFSSTVASSAQRFDDWTMHNFIFSVTYDTIENIGPEATIAPQLALFYKLPINGSNSVLMHAIGGAVVFNF